VNTEQRALQFQCEGHALVGVIDVPERPLSRGMLVVGGGAHCRVGSHRHFALMARQLAPRGFPVMRFDSRGMGDSEGQHADGEHAVQDLRAAIREFRMQMPDLEEVVLCGLGDGAGAAARHAHHDERVKGLVLLHPGFPLSQHINASLNRFCGAVLLVVASAPAEGRLAVPGRRVTVAGARHPFPSREWRDAMAELCANWLVSW
jgi:uncharacterized protein